MKNEDLVWDRGDDAWSEEQFYHPFMAPDRIENQVIDFDIKNLQALLTEKTKVPVEKLAQRVNEHYLDAARLIKRSFGNKLPDDFQLYNWGLTLTLDMGLATDKLELLLNVYAKKMPRRITRADFDYIMHTHSSLRTIADKHKRKLKWMDLVASYKIHTVRKAGFPDTIGKRQFHTILDVNEVELEIDIVRITKDMRRTDAYANKLHMLLLDDPLINGTFREVRKEGGLELVQKERLRDFEARVAAEEEEFGGLAQAEADERMRKGFDIMQKEQDRRAALRKEREAVRLQAQQQEAAEKAAALARLEEVRRDREEWERRKAEKARLEAALERERAEQAFLDKQREEQQLQIQQEQQAERQRQWQQQQQLLQEEAAARAAEEEKEEPPPGQFDHLTGEERLRAEIAARMAEHKRIKAAERKRLLDETRRYAEYSLAGRRVREGDGEGSKLGSAGRKRRAIEEARQHPSGPTAASTTMASMSASTTLRRSPDKADKRGEPEFSPSAEGGEEGAEDGVSPESGFPSSITRLLRPPRERRGRDKKGASRASKDARSHSPEQEARRIEQLVSVEVKAMEEAERREKRQQDEKRRLDAVRRRLRVSEEERIRQIEAEESRRERERDEETKRRSKEEADRLAKETEAARVREEREARLAEAAMLRKIAEEHTRRGQAEREAHQAALKDATRELQLQAQAEAREEAARKQQREREAKRHAAREKARRLKEENEEKRAVLASVIDRGAQAAAARARRAQREKREKGRSLSGSRERGVQHKGVLLDDSELWPEGGASFSEGTGLDGVGDDGSLHGSDNGRDSTKDGSYLYLGDQDGDSLASLHSLQTEAASAAAAVEEEERERERAAEEEREREEELARDRAIAEIERLAAEALLLEQEEQERLEREEAEEHARQQDRERLERELADAKRAEEKARENELAAAALLAEQLEREAIEKAAEEERERARLASSAAALRKKAEQAAEAERRGMEEAEREAVRLAAQVKQEEEEERANIERERLAQLNQVKQEEELRQEQERARAAAQARAEAEAAEREEEERRREEMARLVKEREEEERQAALLAEDLCRQREEEEVEQTKRRQEAEARKREEMVRAAAITAAEEQREREERERMDRERETQEAAERAKIEEERRRREEAAREAEIRRLEEERLAKIEREEQVRAERERLERERLDREEAERQAEIARRLAYPLDDLQSFEILPPPTQAPPMSLEELALLPAVDIELLVPISSDGRLRLFIRHDDEGDAHGLFIAGFRPDSAAERQGLLREGDELLWLNGVHVKGLHLEDVVEALKPTPPSATQGYVSITVRRHLRDPNDQLAQELAALEVEARGRAMDAMLDEIERQQAEALASGKAIDETQAKAQREAVERIVREQKQRRQAQILKEAEERAKKAAAMPNSLMTAEAVARAAKKAPYEDHLIEAPKTQGELRIHVKFNRKRGLFVHGFKADSLAEQQGLVKVGDELLTIEEVDMRGKGLPDLVLVLKGHGGDTVHMKVRRHRYVGVEV